MPRAKKLDTKMGRPPKYDQTLEPHIERLYQDNDYPADRLVSDPGALIGFTAELGRRSRKTDLKATEVGRQLLSLRCSGKLPRLGTDWRGPKFRVDM